MIEAHGREYQIVEVLTFAAAFSASILLTVWARCAYKYASRSDRIGIAAVAVIALAAFFFAGEEISWGQTHIGWGTPEGYRELAAETNLHNTFIPDFPYGSIN